jgi:hypothetical protein
MSFSYSVNNTPTTGAGAMAIFCSTLVAAGWTLPQWSDGTTIHTSGTPTQTQLQGTYAWVRAQAPADYTTGHQREICFQQFNKGSGGYYEWPFKYSARAGFTNFTGTAVNCPAAIDEVAWAISGSEYNSWLGNSSSSASIFATMQLFDSDGGYRFHTAAGNAGTPDAGSFYFISSTTSTTTVRTGFMMDIPTPWAQPSSFTISNASNASPIEITTSTTNTLMNGQPVAISGVGGNTAANGTWQITVIDSSHFTLNNSTGNGSYTSGGTVFSGDLDSSCQYYLTFSTNIFNPTDIGQFAAGHTGLFVANNPATQANSISYGQIISWSPQIRNLTTNSYSGDVPLVAPLWFAPGAGYLGNSAKGVATRGFSRIMLCDLGNASRTNYDLFNVNGGTGNYIWVNGTLLPWLSGTSPLL